MDYVHDDEIGDYESYDDDQTERVDQESPRAEVQKNRRERNRDLGNRRAIGEDLRSQISSPLSRIYGYMDDRREVVEYDTRDI
ncbi:hypothetical protein Droror1_Dr00016727 [Drosera rotundifolia]